MRSMIGYKRDSVCFRMLWQILLDNDTDAPERRTYRQGEREKEKKVFSRNSKDNVPSSVTRRSRQKESFRAIDIIFPRSWKLISLATKIYLFFSPAIKCACNEEAIKRRRRRSRRKRERERMQLMQRFLKCEVILELQTKDLDATGQRPRFQRFSLF